MRVIVRFLCGRLRRRAIGRCLRIVEILLRRDGLGTHGRRLAGHGRARARPIRRILLRITRSALPRRRIRGSGRRIGRRRRRGLRGRCRLCRLLVSHAGTAGIGIEPGIPVKDEIFLVACRRIAVAEENGAAALMRVARQIGKDVSLLRLLLLGRCVRPSVRPAQLQDVRLRLIRRRLLIARLRLVCRL